MKSVCCNAGYNYLGLNFVYLNQQEYLFKPDGLHPNEMGKEIIIRLGSYIEMGIIYYIHIEFFKTEIVVQKYLLFLYICRQTACHT